MTEQDPQQIEYNPKAEHENLKNLANKLGLDQDERRKLLLGQVAWVMSGDDENAFVTILNHPLGFTPELGTNAKKRILDKLEWEINLKWDDGTSLLPERLKRTLGIVIENIKNLDFSHEQNFKRGHREWQYTVQDYYEDESASEVSKMLDARSYYSYITKGTPYKSS